MQIYVGVYFLIILKKYDQLKLTIFNCSASVKEYSKKHNLQIAEGKYSFDLK